MVLTSFHDCFFESSLRKLSGLAVVCFPEEGAVMGLGGQGPEKLADASGSKRIRVCS